MFLDFTFMNLAHAQEPLIILLGTLGGIIIRKIAHILHMPGISRHYLVIMGPRL